MSDRKQEALRPGVVWRGRTTAPPARVTADTRTPPRTSGGLWRGAREAASKSVAAAGATDAHAGRESRSIVWRGNLVVSAPTPSAPPAHMPPNVSPASDATARDRGDLVLTAETSLDDLFRALVGEPA